MIKETIVGVVGLGYWGPNLIRNFSAVEGCEVRYGCDVREGVFESLKRVYPETLFTSNYSDLLNDKRLDLIAIATPVSTHFELAKQAIEHKKHVLIEKPMAASVEECKMLIASAKENKVKIMVDHTFLFTGAVRKIKELVDEGELGDIYYFDSERINLGLLQEDINVIWDLAPHDISIMQYLFEDDRPISVFATGTNHVRGVSNEVAHITVDFESGAVGHIHVSWLSPVKLRKTLIGGSKKMILYNDIEPTEKIKIYDKGIDVDLNAETPFLPVYRSGDVLIPKINSKEALLEEAEHVIRCVRGEEKPLASGEEGLEVVEILEASDKSLIASERITL